MSTASDPPIQTRSFTDPEAYLAYGGMGGVKVAMRRGTRFRASLTLVRAGPVRMRAAEATVNTSLVGQTPHSHAFVFPTADTAPRILSGRLVPAGTIYHPRPNEELFARSPGVDPWPWMSLGADYDALQAVATALIGRNVLPSRVDAALISPPPALRDRVLALMRDAQFLSRTSSDLHWSPRAAQAFGDTVLEALVTCLASGAIDHDRSSVRRHAQIMRRLEAYLDAHAEDAPSLAAICTAVGVAQRSLNLICHEFTGYGVVQYARRRRLLLVYHMLQSATSANVRVADVAMLHGFWELGRFAAAYRDMFGELPSATLAKALR